jgi:hypothetical protein
MKTKYEISRRLMEVYDQIDELNTSLDEGTAGNIDTTEEAVAILSHGADELEWALKDSE